MEQRASIPGTSPGSDAPFLVPRLARAISAQWWRLVFQGFAVRWSQQGKTLLIVAAILAYAILIRVYNLNEPWGRDLLGMNGAWHSIIARNFLQHGLVATKGAPVLNATQDSPSDWTVYLHHPPLLDWSVALSFSLFGIHEWSARLVFLLTALGCIERVFTLARRLFSTQVALGAAFFMATIPISAIYSMHVDFQGSMVLYFALGAFCAYERFVRMGKPGFPILVIVWTTLCCLTDWPGFYIPALLLAHSLVAANKPARKLAIFLSVHCVLLFALFLVYCSWVKGDLWFLLHQLSVRCFTFHDDSGHLFTVMDWFRAMGSYLWNLYTPPVLFGLALWIVITLGRWKRQARGGPASYVWMLLGFGVMHLVIPMQAAYQHDCLAVYLSPGIALCLGIVCHELLGRKKVDQPTGYGRAAVLGVSLVCLTAWFAVRSVTYPSSIQTAADRAYGYNARELGNVVRAHTDRGDGAIIACEETCAPAVWYYADRPLTSFVWSPESLQEVLEKGTYWGPECFEISSRAEAGLCVIPKKFAAHYEDLILFLRSRYAEQDLPKFMIFKMRPDPADRISALSSKDFFGMATGTSLQNR